MRALLLASAAALVVAAPAAADPRVQVAPYIEIDQGVDYDITHDDAVTYTQLAAGIEAQIDTPRATGQVAYRYERRIVESGRADDSDIHTGLARVSYRVAEPLTLEAGAIATRVRSDIRGSAVPFTDTSFGDNLTEVYSVYAGPTFSTHSGPLDIGAAYRFGYTKSESPNSVSLAPGSPRLDYFDESYGHAFSASVGSAPNKLLPLVGITVSGGWERDEASQLDQRYDNLFGRADALVPVSSTLAVTAGVGWQKLTISERDPKFAANGAPVFDRNGRFVTDKSSPRHLDYHTDGLIYDAGVVWRPSPRTNLTAVVAHQYDSTTYTGSFGWQVDRNVSVAVAAYDSVQTFGHQLREGLQLLPTDFVTQRDSYGQQFNGCVFAAQPAKGAGSCLSDIFQSILTASYRARGIDGLISASRGRNSFGLGAGYATRHLLTPRIATGTTIAGFDDSSWYLDAFYTRQITARSNFNANLVANWYDSGLGSQTMFGAGATGAYNRSFGRVGAVAQLGLYTYNVESSDDQWTASALVGARYQF